MNLKDPFSVNKNHIPQLDGLRGVAILLVLTYHYFGSLKIFSFGWSGVDLFFVLSGYLITGKLIESVGTKNYITDFFRNRILRIFPLYYTALFLFYFAVAFIATDKHIVSLSFYIVHWKSFFLFTENWAFLYHGFPTDKYLLHFWSLAIEEQFYIGMPFIILFIRTSNTRLIIFSLFFLLALSLRCVFYFGSTDAQTQHYFNLNTFCRTDSFMAGAILSQLHYSGRIIKKIAINVVIIISISLLLTFILYFKTAAFYNNPLLHVAGFSLVAILYAALLHKAVSSEDFFLNQFLSAVLLRFFGKISYGLYIFHLPVLLIAYLRIYNWEMLYITKAQEFAKGLSLLICVGLSLTLSIFSYYYFEWYFISLKKRRTYLNESERAHS